MTSKPDAADKPAAHRPFALSIRTSAAARFNRAFPTRNCNRFRIDLGGDNPPVQRSRGPDGKNAAAGPDVEDFRRRSAGVCAFRLAQRFAHPVEGEQAAARRAVMAAAERKRRLDFNADAVDRNAAAIMRAVHQKTAGFDRRQALQAFADPVGGIKP